MTFVFLALGLIALVVGASLPVRGAAKLAISVGVSPLVVGLTVVAFGTSAPETAVSVGAALQGNADIAVGNVVGSNTFNILGGLGASGLIAPAGLVVSPPLLAFDLWVMLGAAVACFPIFVTDRQIARWEGAVFLLCYVAYTVFPVLAATHHAALKGCADTMLEYVLPLTVIVLVVSLVRSNATRA